MKSFANNERVPLQLVKEVAETGRLPVPNFAAGGVATPADAALLMQVSFFELKFEDFNEDVIVKVYFNITKFLKVYIKMIFSG